MAPATVVELDLQNLSSNWKKLQETQKRPSKRKGADLQNPRRSLKRKKLENPSPKLSDSRTDRNESEKGLSWSSSQKQQGPSASLALWARDNDVSRKDLNAAYGTSLKSTSIPDFHVTDEAVNEGLSPAAISSVGKYIAIDCEMVGVGPTPDTDSALARVSIVNYQGYQLYDSFVQPKEIVTDYRTPFSGITPALLSQARTLEAVQSDIMQLLEGRILVGHGLRKDLHVMMLGHPKRDIRDTSRHPIFRLLAGGRTPSLKKLAKEVLDVDIQAGEHSSIEDARAAMLLFRTEKESFEREHLKSWGPDRKTSETSGGNRDPGRGQKRKKKVKK